MADRLPARGPKAAIPLGRWFGIEVGADYSWLIIFLLITLSLAEQYGDKHPDWSGIENWSLGLVTSVLFFVSIVLHELGHSLTAVRLGVPVQSITLFIFGGLARISKEPERPRDEFLIAIAGPAVSLALAAGFLGVAVLLGSDSVPGSAARWLGRINGTLFIFNMLPGFPLDGGRVLRALVWAVQGEFGFATRVAAICGSVVAYGFMAIGVAMAFIGGNFVGGLWIGFIGWFLLSAARSGAAHGAARTVLTAIPASTIMQTDFRVVPPGENLQAVVDFGVLRRGERCFLVGEGGRLSGLLTLQEIRAVNRDRWPFTRASEVMRTFTQLRTITPDTHLFDALRAMDEAGVNQLPVVRERSLVGLVTRERLLAVLRNQMEMKS